jgi:LacI family transcriptional regulator
VKDIQKARIPIVNVSNNAPPPGIPLVCNDDYQIGRMGAEHLLSLGFKNYAFLGFMGHAYSDMRRKGYVERLAEEGLNCLVWKDSIPAEAENDFASIRKWLAQLPLPIALMCCNDIRAKHAINMLIDLDVEVPDQAAVLGVDNDLVQCEFCDRPISSVVPAFDQIGYSAAELLHKLMSGQTGSGAAILIPPVAVEARRSTDTLAVADPMVQKALSIIRTEACTPLRVRDILTRVPLSRRPLEKRFFQAVGRTLHEEILRTQMEHARRLLAGTDMSVLQVSLSAGLANRNQFTAHFRKHFGVSPADYRKNLRGGMSSAPLNLRRANPQAPRCV